MQAVNFHVPFVPGTVRYLVLALASLVRASRHRFVAVANGLDAAEASLLRRICEHLGLDNVELPNQGQDAWIHGRVLDWLFANRPGDPHFAFCDSDIFALAPFDAALDAASEQCDVFSSCAAMFWDTSRTLSGTVGRCDTWPDGSPGLSSFFCIYDAELLQRVVHDYAVSFEHLRAVRSLPARAAEALRRLGWNGRDRIDTGKAVNACLIAEGARTRHAEIARLLHVGGVSSWLLNGEGSLMTGTESGAYVLRDEDLDVIAPPGHWLHLPAADSAQGGEQTSLLRRQQRLAAARYAAEYLRALVDRQRAPSRQLSNAAHLQRLDAFETAATAALTQVATVLGTAA